MKLITSSGKTILKLTLAELHKEAMPINIDPIKPKLKEDGWAVDPSGIFDQPIQDVGVRKVKKVDPTLDLSLPKIYHVKPEDAYNIEGKLCIIIDVDPPKEYKRVPKEMQGKVDACHSGSAETDGRTARESSPRTVSAFELRPARRKFRLRTSDFGFHVNSLRDAWSSPIAASQDTPPECCAPARGR